MRLWAILMACLTGLSLHAQLELSSSGTPFIIDFDATVSGVSNGSFAGSGFTPNPTAGQLDSDAWKILGCSDGDLNFGASGTTGDFARGISNGAVTTGGIYSFNVSSGNRALGFQPSGSDLTPGSIILRLENTTGAMITRLSIDYLQYIYNDQNRSNEVVVSFSYDSTTWIHLDTIMSPELADPSPSWVSTPVTESIGVLFPNNSYLYLRWRTEDLSGSGTRDEFAVDDIAITPTTSPEWVYINEIMANPDIDQNGVAFPTSDSDAEWFELHNPLPYEVILTGLLVEDQVADFVLTDLVIPAEDSIVLGQSNSQIDNGGYTCDYAYGNGFGLNNTGDQLMLLYPDNTTIDEVDFSSWGLLAAGSSMRFTASPAADNNLESNWINSTLRAGSYISGQPNSDLGSPGTAVSFLLSNEFVALQVKEEPNGIRLTWTLDSPLLHTFQLEHSIDGSTFGVVSEPSSFSWLHQNPEQGDNYYRLRAYDNKGEVITSKVVMARWGASAFHWFPNPSNGQFTLFYRGESAIDWTVEVYTITGKLLRQLLWAHSGNSSTMTGDLALPAGQYIVIARFQDGTVAWQMPWQIVH